MSMQAGADIERLAEIDRQRASGWPDFHPEDYCHRCGARNLPSWYVDADTWNPVMRPDGDHTEPRWQEILCPQCFAELHDELHSTSTTWELRPVESS